MMPQTFQHTGGFFDSGHALRCYLGIVGGRGEHTNSQPPRRLLHQVQPGALRFRNAKRVATGRAGQHIQHAGAVSHRPGHHMVGRSTGPGLSGVGPYRDPAAGWLQSKQPVVSCRNADGTTAIVGSGHGNNTSGYRGTGAPAGAPGRQFCIPGIAARAPKGRFGDGLEAKLRRCRATDEHQAGLTGTLYEL